MHSRQPETFSTEREMDLLRQRLKADRARTDRERVELLSSMHEAMDEAKRRQAEQQAAMRQQGAFLRRCRLEHDAARKEFDQDMRRRQAYFDEAAAHSARREADREAHAEEQRRREAHAAGPEYGLPAGNARAYGRTLPMIASTEAEKRYAHFEREFALFEDGANASYGLADVPWLPASLPVSGVRCSDTVEQRKQRLKLALLRWHPDKFEAAHGSKLIEADRAAVMERVNAMLRRVQAERAAWSEGDETAAATVVAAPHAEMMSPISEAHRRAAAAAAARSMPHVLPAGVPRYAAPRMPKVMRPSRAAAMASPSAGAGKMDATASGPRSDKYVYEGRYR